jgi:hypothetical protein
MHQTSGFCLESGYAFRKTNVRSTNGASAIAHIPSMHSQVSQSLSEAYLFTSRSVSLPGFRATNLPRESARHRNLFARSSGQALSLGYPRKHRQEHTGRCERITQLANLSRFCAQLNQNSTQTLFTRQLCRGARADRLRTRYHDYRPVLERLPLGALSHNQSCRQNAHAAQPARQYSELHSHQRRQDARGQCARHSDTRSPQLLHHGSGFHRFRSLVNFASSTGILRDSWQIQSTLSSRLLSRSGQGHGTALGPDHFVNCSEGMQGLPATFATHQILRCLTRQASGVSNQQLRLICPDHHSALSLSLASRAVLQMG